MTTAATISLDDNWLCEYFETDPDLFEFAASGQRVSSLREWVCSGRYDESWAAWLQRRFDLPSTDFCVRYTLHIDAAPNGTVLYLNGRRMGTIDSTQPFSFDVTDYVTLEDNRIAFRAGCEGGRFGSVFLRQRPCE